jgi:hypothetical protein
MLVETGRDRKNGKDLDCVFSCVRGRLLRGLGCVYHCMHAGKFEAHEWCRSGACAARGCVCTGVNVRLGGATVAAC